MQIIQTDIEDVILIRPEIYRDHRGDFRETYREDTYLQAGVNCRFVQDNLVHSKKNVFRGLHFQFPPFQQAKLITMINGDIVDVALDLRHDSPTHLKIAVVNLSADSGDQLFIPAGFAHGYYVLSPNACISYKVSAPYSPRHQGGIRWDDPQLDLKRHFDDPILSEQDKILPYLKSALANINF